MRLEMQSNLCKCLGGRRQAVVQGGRGLALSAYAHLRLNLHPGENQSLGINQDCSTRGTLPKANYLIFFSLSITVNLIMSLFVKCAT